MDSNHLRLRIAYDTRDEEVLKRLENNGILVEYSTEDFKNLLIEEYSKVNDISRAFDRVCDALRVLSGTV